MMTENIIIIWGSCVSRDAIEFAAGLSVGKYCARQSIVSSVAECASPSTISALALKEGTHQFYRRCIEDDFKKSTLESLSESPLDEMVVVDFIEERVPLGVTRCNTLVTFSEAASMYSNAESLLIRKIEPWSSEYIDLFDKAIVDFSYRLKGRPVVIHYSLYAEHRRKFPEINSVLSHFYEMAIKHLKPVAVIEIQDDLLISSPMHKWGQGPYHYIDGYYRQFVEKLALLTTGMPVSVKPDFTLQKTL